MQRDLELRSPRLSSENHRLTILRKAFDVYDVDGSGAIDYKELKRLLQDLGWPSHDEFLNRAVRVLDQDMSGEIEFSEFQKWTAFAYASRILYRQEMYGAGPRYAAGDEMTIQPVVQDSQDDRRGLVIRRASLTTVFEGREDNEAEESSTDKENAGVSSGDDEEEGEKRGVQFRSDWNNTVKYAEAEKVASRGSRPGPGGIKDSYDTRASVKTNFHSQSEHEEAWDGKHSNSERSKNVTRREKNDVTDEYEAADQEFSAPVKEIATMVLGPSRRGNRIHTSRSRSKSASMLNHRRDDRTDRTTLEEETLECDADELGPRTESKMTIRMRWACGQFRKAVSGDESQSRSSSLSDHAVSSQNENEPDCEELMKMCNPRRPTNREKYGPASDSLVHRHRSDNAETADETPSSESYDVWQEVGVDLRRIRSD